MLMLQRCFVSMVGTNSPNGKNRAFRCLTKYTRSNTKLLSLLWMRLSNGRKEWLGCMRAYLSTFQINRVGAVRTISMLLRSR